MVLDSAAVKRIFYGLAGLDMSIHLFRLMLLLKESRCSTYIGNGNPYIYLRNARACGTAGRQVMPLSAFP
jgi:hypothetical protein